MTCERYKPYEVLRLLPRAAYSKRRAASIFRFFKSDRLGCGVPKDVLLRACSEAKMAKWGIAPVVISSDIVVFYLGPEHRLESAVAFINTQIIDDASRRYKAERPLRETTHLRHSYSCRKRNCCHYCAWWCVDIDHQFALFKTRDSARLFLSALLTTDLSKIGLEDFLKGES